MNATIKDIDDGQPTVGAKVNGLGFLKHTTSNDSVDEYYTVIEVDGKSGKKYRIEANIKHIDELEE
jgi:hypothetical protein